MIFRLRYLPPFLGVIGAIAGMAIASGWKPLQSKAYLEPYATSVLSLERLKTLDYFATSKERHAEGLLVHIAPQSTYAVHSWFGSPAFTSETQDVYAIAGTDEGGIVTPRKVTFYYEADPNSNYALKASSVWIPSELIKAK